MALRPSRGRRRHQIVRLPDTVVALRLGPEAPASRFRLGPLAVRELSAPLLGIAMLCRRIARARRQPGGLAGLCREIACEFRSGGILAFKAGLRNAALHPDDSYAEWLREYGQLGDPDRAAIRRHIAWLPGPPLLSIVMLVGDNAADGLALTVGSLERQLYPHWELCLAAAPGAGPVIREDLARRAAGDARIRTVRLDGGAGAATLNAAA